MCIRDRASLDTYEPLTADSGTFASKEKQAERKRLLARKAMDRRDPVSYTHLTLPTSDLV